MSTQDMTLVIAGERVPMRAQTSTTSGNTYFAVLAKKANGDRYFSRFGVRIPALAKSLPTSAELVAPNGETFTVALSAGLSMQRKPQAKHAAAVDVPGLGRKFVEVKISDLGEQEGSRAWNLNAVVRGVSGGGGGRKTVELSEL